MQIFRWHYRDKHKHLITQRSVSTWSRTSTPSCERRRCWRRWSDQSCNRHHCDHCEHYLPHRHHWQYCKHYHNCEHNHHHHCHHHNDVTTRRSKMIPCRALFSLSISSSWRSGWFILIIIRSVLLAIFIIIRPVHLKLGQLKIVLFIIRLVLSQPSLRIYNQVTIPPHFYYGFCFHDFLFQRLFEPQEGVRQAGSSGKKFS